VLLFLFLPHTGPDVGYHQVGTAGGVECTLVQADPLAAGLEYRGVGFMPRRAGDSKFEVEADCRVDV
jgi:hypothetical protein